MAQMWYDVIPHNHGWGIVITDGRSDAFATKKEAFDAAVDLARKLRYTGYSVHVRVQKADEKAPGKAA
jgi:hypothetical protein